MTLKKNEPLAPSRELTLLQQAAHDLAERMKAVKKRDVQRQQLVTFLKAHTLLTKKDVVEIAGELLTNRRGGAAVASQRVAAVGRAIAEAREAKGLTAVSLGKRIGRHATAITGWEAGRGFPAPNVRAKLGKALGINVQALINGDARSTT